MSKDINDKKYGEYRKKQWLRYLYIFIALLVIAVEILVLCNIIHVVWGIVAFVILYLLKKILIK